MTATNANASLEPDVDTLRHRCGLAERPWVERLALTGADRQRFLNAYVTCDVKPLAPGQGAHGFFTNPQGRVLADLTLAALADRLWIEVPAGQGAAIVEHLRRYVIADRVEIAPLADVVTLTLAGPEGPAALRALAPGFEAPEAAWSHTRAVLAAGGESGDVREGGAGDAGVEVVVQRGGRAGVPALTLWVPAAAASRVRRALAACEGVREVGPEALEAVRVEAGIARFGVDFGPQNFPQETGADDAVSYTKGCYLGQEVVARIHYRGGVQKMLCGLVFEGAAGPPTAGTPLHFEGREAGTLGTVVMSPALGRMLGLAILHKRASEPGARLDLAGGAGGSAEVRALPFVQAG